MLTAASTFVSSVFPILAQLFITLKKIIFITLAVLLLLQSGGSLLVFQAQRVWVHCKMVAAVQSPSAITQNFRLSIADFKSGRRGADEVVINGESYDIRSVIPDHDSVTVVALRDVEEDNIFKKIHKAVNGSADDDVPDSLINLLALDYIIPTSQQLLYYPAPALQPFAPAIHEVLERSVGIVLPPPELG